jgi:acetyl/propionyl-CoA carboxylase alpha subunit
MIADRAGTAWALGVRDCSVQRGNQKIIEESASPVLSAEQAAELMASAERLAVAVGYCGAATGEFLYHPVDQLFTFPRGQHAPAGRASGHGADYRVRPG